MQATVNIEDYTFTLPESAIALEPARPKERAKLLSIQEDSKGSTSLFSTSVAHLPELFIQPTVLVFNDTKVLPARLVGWRLGSNENGDERPVSMLLLNQLTASRWRARAKHSRKLHPKDRFVFPHGNDALHAEVVQKDEDGAVVMEFFESGATFDALLERIGRMPLPPYILKHRESSSLDTQDYQTLFARHPGAIAAPTAGLHFTPELIERLKRAGHRIVTLTLHVGEGTFKPMAVNDLRDHTMHAEHAIVTEEVADLLNRSRSEGWRILCIGTTSLRALESCLDESGRYRAYNALTRLFLTPGTRIRSADQLLTNFHLPRSTLFVLTCAFCGLKRMQLAYAYALNNGFRFYSYGDACLLTRAEHDHTGPYTVVDHA